MILWGSWLSKTNKWMHSVRLAYACRVPPTFTVGPKNWFSIVDSSWQGVESDPLQLKMTPFWCRNQHLVWIEHGLSGQSVGAGAGSASGAGGGEASWWVSCSLVSHKVFSRLFCESQLPHKSVNVFFIISNVTNNLKNLCGNWLLQNDFINTFCEINCLWDEVVDECDKLSVRWSRSPCLWDEVVDECDNLVTAWRSSAPQQYI